MTEYSRLAKAVIQGDWEGIARLTAEAVASGTDPHVLVSEELQPAMGVVGDKFSSGEYFLPDMLAAGRAMNSALDILKPLLTSAAAVILGKAVVGTVKGDVHDIGKNIVVMSLRGAGFEVTDLGVDVPDGAFVDQVRAEKPDILGLSALLTTTMPSLGSVIKALEAAGLRSRVKVIVGGAPVTQGYADMIGANGYGRDAGQAARKCRQFME